MDRVLISCERFADLPAMLALAESAGLGLELQEFGNDPDLLDGAWRSQVQRYRKALSGFSGELALHGAFLDMYPGSPDRSVVKLAREHFQTNLIIAAELGAHIIDFHANFLPLIDDPHYMPGWIERQIAFWSDLAPEAMQVGVTMVLENMWEPDPIILRRVVEAVDSPFLRSCIDVGHACIYSKLRVVDWIETLKPYLTYTHLHNTDVHLSFGTGVLDMRDVLDHLRHILPTPPILCLELPTLADIKASLSFLNLGHNLTK
jgi:sugar phosphate isomerase/epimerase